jgi:hypothetical protein
MSDPHKPMTGKQTYHVITDTVTGANLRWKDNLFQAVGTVVLTAVGAGIAYALAEEPLPAMLIGALGGLIAGALLTGVILMIYRAVKHIHGQHD